MNAGVVHREIKPRDVMVVGADECVKLTDCGIARLRRIATGGALSRPVGVAHEYAAPEQLVGSDAADRTDIYALGAVLYAMLTGAILEHIEADGIVVLQEGQRLGLRSEAR